MKYNISDYRLQVIVDELGEEYKDLLVEYILDDMHESDVDLINPSDLIRLDVTTKSNLRISKRMQRKNRMLSMISLLGITYALLGLMMMMWSVLKDTIRYDSLMVMSSVLMFMGLFVSMFSLVYKGMVKTRPQYYTGSNHSISPYEIVDKWKEIEALIHELTPNENEFSFSSMVINLKETKIISEQDIQVIQRLLSIRNQIVHGNNKHDLPQNELRDILLQAEKLISKLKKLV